MAEFLDVDIDMGFMKLWMVGPENHRLMEERSNTAGLLYQAQVAKVTGRLAASAHSEVHIGGVHNDRFVGDLVVGGRGVDYAAAHEFGRGEHPGSIHQLDAEHDIVQHPAHDLNVVLSELGHF